MDFTSPAIGQNYSSGYTANIITNQKDLAKWLDSTDIPSPTGLVANIKRYNATNQIFERRNTGNTAWEELPLAYAKLASPVFTGTPQAPTAAVDTETVQIATTQFVLGQAGTSNPLINGTAAPGTSKRYARQDHVHPTDTTRAPLASPNFTGTPQVGGQNIWHAGNFTPSNYAALSGATFSGDITTYRNGAPTTGVIYLNQAQTRYLYYDGSSYVLANASMSCGGTVTAAGGFTNSSARATKMNIGAVKPGALGRVMQWGVIEYEYIKAPGRRRVGVIADDTDSRISTGDAIDLDSAVFELAAAVKELAARI